MEVGRIRRARRRDTTPARTLSEAFTMQLLANPVPTWVYCLETLDFLEVNDAAVAYYGYTREQFLSMTIDDLRPPDDERCRANATTVRPVLDDSGLRRHRRADGTVIDVEVTSNLLSWDDRPAALVVAHDVTEIQYLHTELSRRARVDERTGLDSAEFFIERVEATLAVGPTDGHWLGVLVVALDHLDDVASTMGNHAADALVNATTGRLRASCPPGAALAGLGGGRFAIMCAARPEREVLHLASEVARELASPVPIPGRGDVKSLVSVGLALADGDTVDAASLLADATSAMRHASDRYGDHFQVFNNSLRQDTLAAFQTERALASAAHRGELHLVYQPIVDLHTGESACEALLRWDRPGFGPVGPDQFIPLAEHSELIVDLGGWVIDNATREVAHWSASQRPTRVGINLSVRQLHDGHLVERLTSACARSGLAPSSVCVELTESAFVATNDFRIYRILETLRDLGVKVAIDDFGTGYSSLSYLKHLPFDVVKIDRSFVAGLGVDRTDALLIDAVIRVVHGLGLRVIAEGVETPAQLATLRDLGCDAVQGFLFARPVPGADLAEAIARASDVVA